MAQLQDGTGISPIEFSSFAQLTAPFLKEGMSQAEYARTLLLGVCAFEDLSNNPVSNKSDTVMKRYFTGNRSIRPLASEIAAFVDPEQLEPFFNKLGFEAEMELYKKLSPYCPNMTDRNVVEEAPRLLAKIIIAAASDKSRTKKESDSQAQREDVLAYIQEANCRCPLCSRKLIKMAQGKIIYLCNVTRITPNSLNSTELNDYAKSNTVFPEPGSVDDYIALCPNCSREYQASADKNSVKRLLEIKHFLKARSAAAEQLEKCNLDEEIETVLESLCCADQEEIEINLRLEALPLKSKINDSESLLRSRIGLDVARYYKFIESSLRKTAERRNDSFNRTIASQIQTAYLVASSNEESQSFIFEALVDWLHEKAPNCNRTACEIVISFFVQNCEVFDEITK